MVRKRLVAEYVNGICSETASLTMLETLVHLHAAQIMDSFTLLSIDVPDELIQSANMDELPGNWADEDAPQNWLITEMPSFTELGCTACSSALSPVEFNYLLNPEHPEFYGIVQKAQQIPFRFDSRLKPDRK